MVKYLNIKIRQDLFLYSGIDRFIWKIFIIGSDGIFMWILFSETIEWGVLFCPCAIEYALYWSYAIQCFILHIVWEEHQLGNIDETTELAIGEAIIIHTSLFCNYSFTIIRFLNFNKAEWQTVHKQCYIGTKLILAVFASKFGSTMKIVSLYVVKIYKFCGRSAFKRL